MRQCIPAKVREYWAEELASVGRPEWMSNALMKHFFPKPEYEGRMFGLPVEEGGSVMSADMDKRGEKVLKDVTKYVAELRNWEKDARMKTAMIKKEFILQAFDRVSEFLVLYLGGLNVLTSNRLMRMILLGSASGGSTSSVSTGRLTSTVCSSRCRRGTQIMSATKGVLVSVVGSVPASSVAILG
jgi:hypothetical protein